MKKIIMFALLFSLALCCVAQENVFTKAQAGGKVTIRQSKEIENAILGSIARGKYRKTKGYRVRIFFDNDQAARQRSAAVAANFSEQYPDVPVYREFEDLYYKVAVGDFRTKTDALRFLEEIKKSYALAFIISENVDLQKAQKIFDVYDMGDNTEGTVDEQEEIDDEII